jgi:hypothetical protein
MKPNRLVARLLGILFLVAQFGGLGARARPAEASSQFDIVGPALSGKFGRDIQVFPNGNILILDPEYNGNIGAVYLYNGATHALISALTGSQPGDQVGSDGYALLNSTTVLIFSSHWANGGATEAGAVTRLNINTGLNGIVTTANSLVGDQSGDQVGSDDSTQLANGNYVIISPNWRSGGVSAQGFGAVTWANVNTGIVGAVSAANSLVGDQAGDQVGICGLTLLTNGNYVVVNGQWRSGGTNGNGLGAVTWASGSTGRVGVVSSANSLVGGATGDEVGDINGSNAVFGLPNGDYVVLSPTWRNGGTASSLAGAATWVNGSTGLSGLVTAANSLVGNQSGDEVGLDGVTMLTNGNYVVVSGQWRGGGSPNNGLGAVTWVNENTGLVASVSAANSLVGSHAGDQVGEDNNLNDVLAFANGNYLVFSPDWANGSATQAGAVTWGKGTSGGTTGVVSNLNSLVGTQIGDQVGIYGAQVLGNGKYVISSPFWARGGQSNAGAATFANSASAITGIVTVSNSLVGSHTNDEVSNYGIGVLSNGNYVVVSPFWANSGAGNAGAVTWGNAATGVTGPVSPANSLVGSHANDSVGGAGITPLNVANGAYLVRSPNWKNSGAASAGALTWAIGTSAVTGPVSPLNSLVGDLANDRVGSDSIALPNPGAFVAGSSHWHGDRGAATWGNASTGLVGPITSGNSLVGGQAGDRVGSAGIITGFINGNYVVESPLWANNLIVQAGAVTWGNGRTGTPGVVGTNNSLVGSHASDNVGSNAQALLSDSYVVVSSSWANGGAAQAGAVSLLPATGPTSGPVTSSNSVLGAAANGGLFLLWRVDCVNQQLVVGRPADNIVTLFKAAAVCPYLLHLPAISR